MQFSSVARYGIGEYCSTDPFFHISIKVGLYEFQEDKQVCSYFFMEIIINKIAWYFVLINVPMDPKLFG